MNQNKIVFSKNLKRARKQKKLTQQELSDKVGIKRSAYAYYEVCKSEPNLEVLKKIADELEVTVDYLLTDNDNVAEKPEEYSDRIPDIFGERDDDIAEKLRDLSDEQLDEVANFINYLSSKNK